MTLDQDLVKYQHVYTSRQREALEVFLNSETMAEAAVQLGIDRRAAYTLLDRIKRAAAGAGHVEIPMSEDEKKFHEDWGPGECIDELRRIAEIDPDQVITRNHFRVNSDISESTWNRFFGTFEEFKRQAGVILTRQQHGLERQIAKHVSVDHYSDLDDRHGWGDNYRQDTPGRFKTLLVGSDFHDKECDPFFLEVFLDTADRVQPDDIVLGGDIFDLAEFGKYDIDPREWDAVGRIKFVHENIFEPLRKSCPNTNIDLIEGNHEVRMLRQLADASPALRAVLSDLMGVTVSKLLGLDEYQINYISKADLRAFTQRDLKVEVGKSYKVYYDAFMVHHHPHARNKGVPGINGHHHRHEMWSFTNHSYGPYEWHQLGAGHKREASYCEGENWHNGFAIVHIDTHTNTVNTEYVPVTSFAVVGGKWYSRGNY